MTKLRFLLHFFLFLIDFCLAWFILLQVLLQYDYFAFTLVVENSQFLFGLAKKSIYISPDIFYLFQDQISKFHSEKLLVVL